MAHIVLLLPFLLVSISENDTSKRLKPSKVQYLNLVQNCCLQKLLLVNSVHIPCRSSTTRYAKFCIKVHQKNYTYAQITYNTSKQNNFTCFAYFIHFVSFGISHILANYSCLFNCRYVTAIYFRKICIQNRNKTARNCMKDYKTV